MITIQKKCINTFIALMGTISRVFPCCCNQFKATVERDTGLLSANKC